MATACKCFCGTPQAGAAEESSELDASRCAMTCDEAGKETVGCFTTVEQYPANSDLCWTEGECKGNNTANRWADRVSGCDDRTVHMGYCYAPPEQYTVMTPIGGQVQFSGIGPYVNAIYQYAVPVASIIAVVMLMIAGLQYILARGGADQIKQAKDRMRNAVVGLVLLIGAATLVYLVDPNLTRFSSLEIPLQKEVAQLSDDSYCETLAQYGIEVDGRAGSAVKGTCGTDGRITSMDTVSSEVPTGTFAVGDTCAYSGCGNGLSCTTKGCLACDQLYGTGISATPALCTSLTPPETVHGEAKGYKYYCSYTTIDTGPACISTNYSSYTTPGIKCEQLQSCRDYDKVFVTSGVSWNLGTLDQEDGWSDLFEQVCSEDLCTAAPEDEQCIVASTTDRNCISPSDMIDVDDDGYLIGGFCYDKLGKLIDC